MRLSSPDYRRGWNSIVVSTLPPAEMPALVDSSALPSSAPAMSDQQLEMSAAPANNVINSPAPSPAPTSAPSAAIGLMAVVGVVVILSIALYFIPTLIAMTRHKRNAGAIFALNLFLGWTLLGWVGALVWALLADAHLVRTVE